MTPKEKAKQLYEQYEFVYIQNYTSAHEVKQCALICVEEILNTFTYPDTDFGAVIHYWQSVKTEIEKL